MLPYGRWEHISTPSRVVVQQHESAGLLRSLGKRLCRRFYAPVLGRPSLSPGRYFRLLLVGYFVGTILAPVVKGRYHEIQ